MCGIFGMYGNDPLTSRQVPNLLRVADSQSARGRDAFGFATRSEALGISHHKQQGCVSDNLGLLAEKCVGAFSVIGHTRWTTHGSAADNTNNHPHHFNYRDDLCHLVHNGIVCNYLSIASVRGLRLRTECDSEVIARHIETNDGDILSRVRDAVDDVDSSAPFACAVLVRDGLVLARRGNPLYWSDARTHCWFASTRHALVGKIHEVPDDTAYYIPFGDADVKSVRLRKRSASSARWLGSDLFA
jgi:glucosamine--fructose-6-phosphate aminotransferase (isomerizing)